MRKWLLFSFAIIVSMRVHATDERKSLTVGPDSADHKIIIYSGLTDPWYAFYDQMLKQALVERAGRIQVTFRHNKLSFHPGDVPAAIGAECAGKQGMFWKMHDEITAELQAYVAQLRGTPQSELDSVKPVAIDDHTLEVIARHAGMDMDKYRSCVLSPAVRKTVEADVDEAQRLGHGIGTVLIINGIPEDLPPFYPALKDRLEEIDRKSRPI